MQRPQVFRLGPSRGQSLSQLSVVGLLLLVALGQVACSGFNDVLSRRAGATQYTEAQRRFVQGDYRGAIEILDDLIAHYPGEAVLYYQRGAARNALGDSQAAVADFDEALRLKPEADRPDFSLTEPHIYYQRARAYGRLQDVQHMIDDLDHAVALLPPDSAELPWSYQLRGMAWSISGDQQKAVEDLRIALDLF